MSLENERITFQEQLETNTDRIHQLNQVFVSLGSNPLDNIQTLTETAGLVLGAHGAHYVVQDETGFNSIAEWKASLDIDNKDCPYVQVIETPDCPVIIHNRINSSLANQDTQLGFGTLMGMAVAIGQEAPIGILCILYEHTQSPTQQDMQTVQLLSRAIGQQEQIRQRNHELETLNQISSIIASAMDLDKMLILLERETKNLVCAEICAISLMDRETNQLVVHQIIAPYGEHMLGHSLDPNTTIAGYAAKNKTPILVSDFDNSEIKDLLKLPEHSHGLAPGIRDIICVPLIVHDRVIGVLELFNKSSGHFGQHDLELIESVAGQVASVIENARLAQEAHIELEKRAALQEALRARERQLKIFIDTSPLAISLKDTKGTYLVVNQFLAHELGLTQDEMVGQDNAALINRLGPQAQEKLVLYHTGEHETIETGTIWCTEETISEKTIRIQNIPIKDDQGYVVAVACTADDITKQKMYERERARARREETLLTMAGGIAHDFNNALVGIVGHIDLLRTDYGDNPDISEAMDIMEASAQRMTDLTAQMLAYAGGNRTYCFALSLNKLVASVQKLHAPTAYNAGNIVTTHSFSPNLWKINGDPDQLERMITTLIVNAYEAMSDQGGTLNIKTENVHKAEWISRGQTFAQGDYIHLSIEDTGPGMAPSVQEHLFEPFFTTKFHGRGLGLPAAMGVVRSHKGCIEIESEPERGTIVHIYLPRSDPLPIAAVQTTTEANVILIVEDDPIVRNLAKRVLSRKGYTLLLAESGEEALEIYKEQSAKINLVLLDMGLPGLTGEDVLHHLQQESPEIKVLLSSGYDQVSAISDLPVSNQIQFIQKPYSLQALLDQVAGLLGNGGPS